MVDEVAPETQKTPSPDTAFWNFRECNSNSELSTSSEKGAEIWKLGGHHVNHSTHAVNLQFLLYIEFIFSISNENSMPEAVPIRGAERLALAQKLEHS